MRQGWKRAGRVALAVVLVTVLAVPLLAGCGDGATPTPASLAEAYASSNLDTSYEGALPAATQLALGTLLLEGTANAVTPQQAGTMLALWQALRGGALQDQAEVSAVLGQVERAMTPDQLAAIAAMHLTADDLATWMEQRGFAMPQRPDWPGGTPGALPRSTPGAGGPGNLSPEARETMRAGFGAMPPEERAGRMATAQAGGMPAGGFPGRAGRAGTGTGELLFLIDPLIELLAQRAGS